MFKNKFLPISKIIYNTIKQNTTKEEKILEVGCSSAHISLVLKQKGFNIKGIEIRKEIVDKTNKFLNKKNIQFEIITGNVLNHNEKYDMLWSSGLIQCLNNNQKDFFFEHFIKLANKAIFFVPKRINYLPPTKEDYDIAVTGCEEFPTGDIPFILSKYYNKVKYKIIPKNKIKMDIDFIVYICKN